MASSQLVQQLLYALQAQDGERLMRLRVHVSVCVCDAHSSSILCKPRMESGSCACVRTYVC
eukprot:scaffold122292_cov23-Tisochrysis_lutea.AAC.1